MVGIYNDFYTAQLYMPSGHLAIVSTALYRFIGPYGGKWEVIFAGIIITIIPMLVIFLSLQKYIYAGLVSGSVKGYNKVPRHRNLHSHIDLFVL